MKFKYTILYVENVSASLEFFERAFGLRRRSLHESGDWAELETGATVLSFCSTRLLAELGKTPARASARAPVFEIAFETDDVQGALARALREGALLVQEVREEPWGQTVAYVSDTNGFLIELCTPVRAP